VSNEQRKRMLEQTNVPIAEQQHVKVFLVHDKSKRRKSSSSTGAASPPFQRGA
jgi:hypothetical protein